MQNHVQILKNEKKVKNEDSIGKTNFFLTPCPLILGQF
jgi:hypothetical protein